MEDVLDTVADRGFNLLRIPLCVQLVNQWRNGDGGASGSINYSANPALEGMTSLQILDASITYPLPPIRRMLSRCRSMKSFSPGCHQC
jgi:endoglucanase